MNIGFIVVGDIVVDHVTHAIHVQSSSRHIGCHKNIQFTFLKIVNRLLAFVLRDISAKRSCRKSASLQTFREISRGNLRTNEYDHRVELLTFEHARQCIELVRATHHPIALANRICRCRLGLDLDLDWIRQMAPSDALDRFRHRCREKRDLPAGRRLLHNPFNVVNESHPQHLIGFVQNDALQCL